MSLFVDLPAGVVYLRDRILIKNVREIIHVTCGLKLGNGFSRRQPAQRQNQDRSQTQSRAQIHTQIVQDASGTAMLSRSRVTVSLTIPLYPRTQSSCHLSNLKKSAVRMMIGGNAEF